MTSELGADLAWRRIKKHVLASVIDDHGQVIFGTQRMAQLDHDSLCANKLADREVHRAPDPVLETELETDHRDIVFAVDRPRKVNLDRAIGFRITMGRIAHGTASVPVNKRAPGNVIIEGVS